jgi:hypothetical protein
MIIGLIIAVDKQREVAKKEVSPPGRRVYLYGSVNTPRIPASFFLTGEAIRLIGGICINVKR